MSGNGILNSINPLNMVSGAQRLTGKEVGLHSIALSLAFLGFVALQVASVALNGHDTAVMPGVGEIDVTPTTGFIALIAAGVSFIAAFQLGWNNIPDVPASASPPNQTADAASAQNVVTGDHPSVGGIDDA